jgi:hypothetical protein
MLEGGKPAEHQIERKNERKQGREKRQRQQCATWAYKEVDCLLVKVL